MAENKKYIESELTDLIKKNKNKLIEKEEEQVRLEGEIENLKKKIKTLEEAIQIYKESKGKFTPTEKKFDGVESIREACNILLKEKGEMKRDKLIKELQDGGFDFKGKSPVRVVHIAMVNNPYATITENKTYKLISGPKELPLSVPKAVKKFFEERGNEPAFLKEIVESVKKMEIRTATKNLEGSIKNTLTRKKITEKLEDGRYKLK